MSRSSPQVKRPRLLGFLAVLAAGAAVLACFSMIRLAEALQADPEAREDVFAGGGQP